MVFNEVPRSDSVRKEIDMQDVFSFTPETVCALLAGILALVFAYFPRLRVWYGALASELKSLIMIMSLLVITLVVWLLTYVGAIASDVVITWWTVAKLFVLALIINQPTYMILPEPKDVTLAKIARNMT
jgi:hypothetical protein